MSRRPPVPGHPPLASLRLLAPPCMLWSKVEAGVTDRRPLGPRRPCVSLGRHALWSPGARTVAWA